MRYTGLMKRWLRMISIRFAIVFILVLVLAFAVTWWPAHQAKRLITRQKALSAQAVDQLKQAQSFLDNLPALDPSNIRKKGAIKFYAQQVMRVSDQFNKLTLVRPPDLKPIRGVSPNSEFQVIKDVNFTLARIHQKTVYTNSHSDTDAADKLMAYHAAVSQALVNVLEYDPVADTQGFNIKSADTQHRLSLAHDGLVKTDDELQAARKIYQESSIDEVTALISGLRAARYQLSQDGNTASWINNVEDAQNKIIQNRITFWNKAPGLIKSKLAVDQKQMLMINGLWQADAQKYNLN